MRDTISVDRSDFGTFIHSELDEAGLTPFAFRIYCHLARRANISGEAWPGACSMARITGMGETKVREAIAELEARDMIRVKRSKGGRESNHYHLNSKKFWKPAETTPSPHEGHPLATRGAAPRHTKGSPSPREAEVYPLKDIHEGDPTLLLLSVESNPDKAETIYEAYPRKKSRPQAIKAIRAAVKKVGFDFLLKAVEAYAAQVKALNTDLDFVPYPATWFNGERWNDQPNTKNQIDGWKPQF